MDAASSSSAAVGDGDEWKLLMPAAEEAPTTAAETGGGASDATASGRAAGDNEGASSSPPATTEDLVLAPTAMAEGLAAPEAGEKAAAATADGSAAAATTKGTVESHLDHVLEALVRARGIAMPHSRFVVLLLGGGVGGGLCIISVRDLFLSTSWWRILASLRKEGRAQQQVVCVRPVGDQAVWNGSGTSLDTEKTLHWRC